MITDRAPGFCRHQLVELGYLHSAHAMGGSSVAFNLQPRVTGQLLIGSSRELVGSWAANATGPSGSADAPPEPRRAGSAVSRATVARMLARALEFVPALGRLDAIRAWTGFRPATPDNLPLIGRWPASERVWIAAGHEGLGITTALATGRLLADLVVGRTPDIAAEPFAPQRMAAAPRPRLGPEA